jgi:hypothetical protein
LKPCPRAEAAAIIAAVTMDDLACSPFAVLGARPNLLARFPQFSGA